MESQYSVTFSLWLKSSWKPYLLTSAPRALNTRMVGRNLTAIICDSSLAWWKLILGNFQNWYPKLETV